ncbi:Carbonic anhydrase [compost metagenome]
MIAGIKTAKDHTVYPGKIQTLTLALQPTINKVLKEPGDLLHNATVQNVKDSVDQLKSTSPVLGDAIASGKLKIVGGIYRLASGKVDLIA